MKGLFLFYYFFIIQGTHIYQRKIRKKKKAKRLPWIPLLTFRIYTVINRNTMWTTYIVKTSLVAILKESIKKYIKLNVIIYFI